MFLVDNLCFKVAYLELERDNLILSEVKLSLNLVDVLLSCNFPLKSAYLRPFAQLSLQCVDFLLVEVLLFTSLGQRLLNGQSLFFFVQ